MSFRDCILRNVDGKLTPKQAEKLVAEYDKLVDTYTKTMGSVDAASKAAQKFVELKEIKLINENNAKVKHAIAQMNIVADIKNKFDIRQKQYAAMSESQRKFERSPSVHHIVGDLYQEVATRSQTIARLNLLKLVDFINENGSKMLGFVQKYEQLPNIVKAIVGENVPNSMSKQFGGEIRKVMDDLHTRFRNAGGSVGKIVNYFPQEHNAVKIKQVDADTWINKLLPKLDRSKMIDYNTGLPMTDEALIAMMQKTHQKIITNGMLETTFDDGIDILKKKKQKGADVYQRMQDSRVFHFKDADSFLEYNREFGVGDRGLFDAITRHIQIMSRDIALMEKLGPKSNAMAKHLDLLMESQGVGQNGRNFVNGMYNVVSGALSGEGTLPLMYRFLEGTKALTRFLLGGAAVSALPDSVFIRTALKTRGIKQMQAMQNYFNGLNPASPVNQRALQRHTKVMDGLLGHSLESARFADSVGYDGGKVVQSIGFVSSAILRASGLTRLTDQGKMVTMAATMGEFAEHAIAKTAYADLNPDFQAALREFNITPEDYAVITKAKPNEFEGMEGLFLTGQDIFKVEGVPDKTKMKIAANYEDMITRMANLATNEPTLRTQTITTGAALAPDTAKVGSATRAVMGAIMSFKGFPITVNMNFILPLARRAMSGKRADIMSAVEVLGYTTILGAMAYQAKALLRGEEARDMQDPKFWLAAAMQGGGAGIFGDFLFADYSRFNQSFAETLAGPVVGTYGDAIRIINGNYNRAMEEGQESKFFADAWKFSSKFIPGATLWYARLPLERALLDGVSSVLDPDFDKKINTREKKMQRDENRGFWWRPNSGLSGAFE